MDTETTKKPEQSEGHFWAYAGAVVVAVLCTPFVRSLRGVPPLSWPVYIRSSIITIVIGVSFGWLAFRFGRRRGLVIISAALILLGLWLRLRS